VTFGRKDAQQLFLVRRMIDDLDVPVRIEEIPIVREADGLARSSRNAYLSGQDREAATALHAALAAGAAVASTAETHDGSSAALAAARAVLEGEARVRLDYLAVVDPRTFEAVGDEHRGPAILLVAA